MIIKDIVNNDLAHCNKAIRADKELREIEIETEGLIGKVERVTGKRLEELFIAYGARMVSIAYMQGIKDFNEMFIDLKADTNKIIEEMERRIVNDRGRVSNID